MELKPKTTYPEKKISFNSGKLGVTAKLNIPASSKAILNIEKGKSENVNWYEFDGLVILTPSGYEIDKISIFEKIDIIKKMEELEIRVKELESKHE